MGHYIESHRYEDKKILVYKHADYGAVSNYYCRILVAAERRYLVRSTKTKDLEQAREFAMSLFWEAKTLKKYNDTANLWVPTFEAVAKEFQQHVNERVALGLDSEGRSKRIKFGVKVWTEYFGDKKLTQITEEHVEHYEKWRLKTRPQKHIQKTTNEHEYAIYRQVMKFAIKKNTFEQKNITH